MTAEWQIAPLDELYEFSSGLSKPRAAFGTGSPFVSFKDVFYNIFIPKVLAELVQSTEQERERCSVRRGDVFLTRTSETMDELGMSCVALRDIPNATFNGFTKRLRPKDDRKVAPEYAGYFFRSPGFRQAVTAMSSMSTRASLNNEMLARLSITLPPFEEQVTIGHILGTLDDKIELNQRMNETLESTARALFKSWFVEFEPVRARTKKRDPGLPKHIADLFPDSFEDSQFGEIPKGWTVGKVAGLCETIYSGGTPSTKNAEYWNGNVPWLSSGETREKLIIDTEKRITTAGVANSSTREARSLSTVIASAGQGNTRGQTSLLCIDSYVNQSVVVLNADRRTSSPIHLFFDLERRYEEFRRISDGHSSRGSLTTKLLAGLDALFPPFPLIKHFDNIVLPLVERSILNLRESRLLAELRDALLPKLISGELRVSKKESVTEVAA